jgi:tRNA(fMet)-specific endonuclease VapC
MVRYFLDTNAISDAVKNPQGKVAVKLRSISLPDRVCTSIVVAAELHYGLAKKGSLVLAERVEVFLPLNGDVDRYYGSLRADLERRGKPIGANDMWIAAHALAADCVLITANIQEFSRVRGLKFENWEEPRLHSRRR